MQTGFISLKLAVSKEEALRIDKAASDLLLNKETTMYLMHNYWIGGESQVQINIATPKASVFFQMEKVRSIIHLLDLRDDSIVTIQLNKWTESDSGF
jgi:hypothetical protein